ncbi:leucine--tRNA ligase [Ohtaekwangia koreensis]|uniref:Leucine--tRNA ligase n=1 Tax=Ohtaekwangia koreensis TaxID=688867 RepID=A0A1T5JX53_9BACT|nr:leucine--tRNA ligase [Ohtaekwangia koreensis]SKC55977.1 leucyl-tRNA synthetase [Ohtaekwangia koreensis]
MADYSKDEIKRIEKKWQDKWAADGVYKVKDDTSKPKYYVLDMFPYPSGAGLHVGHPLGYIASDIVSRYKRVKGFNVLHPMGFDAFGLPAEQYAIQTGQHPAVTTAKNIETYKRQLRQIGFSYDWDREVQTSDPAYYKWTQWIFSQLFNAWYNKKSGPEGKTEPIAILIAELEKNGNKNISAVCDEDTPVITAEQWKSFDEKGKEDFLQKYRIAYLSDTMVNWCAALGTVLSNDEVKDGVSERGGYPVERIKMMQWSMRITAYAERLLKGLDTIDWPEPVREMQRNWIGKSVGCELDFKVSAVNNQQSDLSIRVFTTRIDTIYGVSFMVIAPEHELVDKITTPEQREEVTRYIDIAKNRSERERMSEVKRITGAFTGAYVINPFNNAKVPVWIADYVLAGYGTGAVMAVPSSDTRDYAFAKHFNLPIIDVLEGPTSDITKDNFEPKSGTMINSDFLNGLSWNKAIEKALEKVETLGIGIRKVNFRMRDAIFGRQRYWGEPFPVYFEKGIPKLVTDKDLPVTLPEIDQYKPTETGEPPLARAKDWNYNGNAYELTTMPGWAGSSWYWFRYMDPKNENEFASREKINYWKDVDLYMGGSEHATGHLLYSRFWCKALKDLGYVDAEEPFKKLINQGHIQGMSKFVYRINGTHKFVSNGLRKQYDVTPLHADVSLVDNDVLDIEGFKKWRDDFSNAEFILEDGKYICGTEIEKMSKSKYNVVNPDDIVTNYGADTLRMYEMFLGPLELSKPWNTNGIDGVYKFLRRFWNLFHDKNENFTVSDTEPTREEFKILHKTIKKIEDDIDRFSFNTSVSEFMICCNELSSLKCNKRAILEPLVIALSPFAPHITEELWEKLGHSDSILNAVYPKYDEQYLVESSFEYPISINGKVRVKMNFALDMPKEDIEKLVMASEAVQKWTEGKAPKKVIIVQGKIVNVVL